MVWLLVGWVAVRLWAFFLLGFHLAACFPYGWLVRQLRGLSPIFPFPVPLESLSLHGSWSGFCRGSPLRVFPLAVFLRVLCLRSGGGGFGRLSLAGPYVLRDVIPGACYFYPLPLLRYSGSFRRPRCACLGLRPFGKCV